MGDVTNVLGRGKDITYVFTDHYVAVVQLVCAPNDREARTAWSPRVHLQLARMDRIVFSSVLVNDTVLLI